MVFPPRAGVCAGSAGFVGWGRPSGWDGVVPDCWVVGVEPVVVVWDLPVSGREPLSWVGAASVRVGPEVVVWGVAFVEVPDC